ncbi:MAG: Trk system potassium transporter TrkA [Planctomycetes bacterium]|jgi:trk system potassium uptake protein TrkA|nr:Trk system potassium transporter TrkA [Planctomycetota bacterium]
MKVVIVGAGQVGFHIAERLSREGHDVSLIERDPEKATLMASQLNALVVQGTGASAESLDQVRIANTDLFIAVTDQDEVNLISCMLAKGEGVKRVISRIRNVEYAGRDWRDNAKKLGIDLLINPQRVVAEEICEVISYPAAADVAEFANGRVVFLGYKVPPDNPLAGITLRELGDLRGMYRLVVAALSRPNETIVPRGDDKIMPGDIVYFLCRKEDLAAINYLFGFEKRQTRTVMVLGGGRIGEAVTRELLARRLRVKVVERSAERCRYLAEHLPEVPVIHAEGTEIEVLKQEGLAETDVFVAVTDGDEQNILCSLLARNHGAKRVIALVSRPEYVSLAPGLGVDACISPRLATAAAILRFVRRGEVLSMAMVEECEAEVMEINLPARSSILGEPLRSVDMPRGSIIGAIVRGDEVIIPGGNDVLEAGDRAVVFTLPEAVTRVEKFFS